MIDASAPITTLDLDLDALAANVMAEWHIPGLALAVLRRDAPPLLQAFGFTDIESRTRVESTTLFPIGSITKSFTATGLGLLVDEGELGWDVPVREILAEFKLKDPVANEKCTLRDLLTHRTGLPRHDWVHTPGHLDNPACWQRCVTSIRARNSAAPSKFQNLMYLVAGMVAERIAGQPLGGLHSGPHPRPARHRGHHDLIGGDGVGAHKPRCAAYV
jgi:CubicO group peptidase (beta-lactamase class C family)